MDNKNYHACMVIMYSLDSCKRKIHTLECHKSEAPIIRRYEGVTYNDSPTPPARLRGGGPRNERRNYEGQEEGTENRTRDGMQEGTRKGLPTKSMIPTSGHTHPRRGTKNSNEKQQETIVTVIRFHFTRREINSP